MHYRQLGVKQGSQVLEVLLANYPGEQERTQVVIPGMYVVLRNEA